MKRHGLSLALVLVATLPVFSQATDPVLDFNVGGATQAAAFSLQVDGSWTAPTLTLGGLTFSDIALTTDSDPFVHYSYSVSNTTGASMLYSTNAVAAATLSAGTYNVNSSLGVSVTDFATNPDGSPTSAGVSVWPASGPLQKAFVDSTEVTSADLGSGLISETNFGATNTQNFSTGPSSYTLGSSIAQISTVTSFNLSNGADVGITGFFQIAPTPEPSSLGLGLVCAGVFAAMAVCSRRTQA